jgi:tRNA (mo5U34)-methyltransferase
MPAPRIWYHTIDFPDGTSSPGWYDMRSVAKSVVWPTQLKGGRCLDVGTFDGFWAFEMERQGAAEVAALDLDDPAELDWCYDDRDTGSQAVEEWGTTRGPGFASAAEKLGSKVDRINCSVYNLDPATHGQFDVVFCGAILLHLRDPVMALEKMRAVCRGTLVCVESVDPYLELAARRRPAAAFHPEPDEWWVVNSAGLSSMVTTAGFRVAQVFPRWLAGYGPGGPSNRTIPWLNSVAARQPTRRGFLVRGLIAEPRPPKPRG